MKVTRDYADVSGGHNTWLCRFLPTLRQRGIESRILCFHLSPGDEFPTARSLRQAGFSCTVSEEEIKYTKQRVRWIFGRLTEDPPDVFVVVCKNAHGRVIQLMDSAWIARKEFGLSLPSETKARQ